MAHEVQPEVRTQEIDCTDSATPSNRTSGIGVNVPPHEDGYLRHQQITQKMSLWESLVIKGHEGDADKVLASIMRDLDIEQS